MLTGNIVNLYVAPADREWEAAMTPIRIPIRKGLLNYRILLINKDTAPAFAKVTSNADLRKLQVGLRPGWTTTKIMRALKLNITEGAGYNGRFKMLNANRFDYIPRGINEIFGEFDARSKTHKNIMIEQNLLLRMPMPVYLYVSRKVPRLAKRIEYGFNKIRGNGKFDALFNQIFSKSISRANLPNRKIFNAGNPLSSKQTPLQDETLWFYPFRTN